MDEIINIIRKRVAADMRSIPDTEIDWVRKHLIEPRPVRFAIDPDGKELDLSGVFAFGRDGRISGIEVWSVDGSRTPTELPKASDLREFA